MKLLLAGTALVRVLGLGVVTDKVPNDPGVRIILPRTAGHEAHELKAPAGENTGGSGVAQDSSSSSSTTMQTVTSSAVETHQAALVFQTNSRVSIDGWTATPVAYPGFENLSIYMVLLNGERIEITGQERNKKQPIIDANLPHIGGSCCSSMTALRPEYQPPYMGAAAVVSVPEGDLNACRASNAPRIDTELQVRHGGELRIVGRTPGGAPKTITFKATPQEHIQILIANVPPAWLEGRVTQPTGDPHHYVYYDMAATGRRCSARLEACCESIPGRPEPCPRVNKTCAAIVWNRNAPPARQIDFTQITGLRAATFECSNTTWP